MIAFTIMLQNCLHNCASSFAKRNSQTKSRNTQYFGFHHFSPSLCLWFFNRKTLPKINGVITVGVTPTCKFFPSRNPVRGTIAQVYRPYYINILFVKYFLIIFKFFLFFFTNILKTPEKPGLLTG